MTGKSSLPRLAAESCRMKPVRERYSTLTVGRVAGSGLGARTGALTGAAAVRSAAFLRAIAAAAAGPSAATASTIQVRSRKCIAQLASVDAAQCIAR